MRKSELAAPDAHRAAMAEAFRHVLGNNCRLFRTALCCSWNARGLSASEAGGLFRKQADEMYAAQDELAERILFVGGTVVPDDSEMIAVDRPSKLDFGKGGVAECADLLARGHEGAILSIEAASDVAREVDDQGSLTVLGRRLVAHQHHLITLRRLSG